MRSAQIEKDEMRFLVKKEKLTDIVNFRTLVVPGIDFDEHTAAKMLNLEYHQIPTISKKPEIEQVKEFLELTDRLKQQSNKKLLAHCKAGADRTGMYVLFYELKNKLKNFQEAAKEMLLMGHNRQRDPELLKQIEAIAKELKIYR